MQYLISSRLALHNVNIILHCLRTAPFLLELLFCPVAKGRDYRERNEQRLKKKKKDCEEATRLKKELQKCPKNSEQWLFM